MFSFPPEPVFVPAFAGLSAAGFAVAALACAGIWLALRMGRETLIFGKLNRLPRPARAVARLAAGTGALWMFWRALAEFLTLATPWPLWAHGLLGAGAIEAALALYALERRGVSRAAGRWLAGLRVTAILAVLTMLAQPVLVWNETRRIDRHVVVLLDDSASMRVADRGMPVAERLTLAEFLGIEGVGPLPAVRVLADQGRTLAARLEGALDRLRAAGENAESVASPLSAPVPEDLKEELSALLREADEWRAALNRASDENDRWQWGLSQAARDARSELRRMVLDGARSAVEDATRFLREGDGRRLRLSLQDAARRLTDALNAGEPYVRGVEEKFYSELPPETRQKIDAAAARTRQELAVEAMTKPGADGAPGALELLEKKYTVRRLRFGRRAEEADGLKPAPAEGPADFRSLTDLTAALRRARESVPPESLAGVVILSDMRHNGPLPPDDAARQLALTGAKICAIPVGSSRGAKDAAILKLEHPRGIFLGDRLRVKASLKADGLRGGEMKVRLSRDGAEVDAQTVKIPDDALRVEVPLSDTPPEKGIFSWRVEIEPLEGELFPENNVWSFDAAVSDDRTNVLLIDNRPRWEFRYLRNLFDSRDKSVHLQYALLEPDTVAGAAPPPDIPASAGRPFGEAEATRPPANAEEWRKFDVIILGDVSPSVFTEEIWSTLRECVGARGALLILIAGEEHMPRAFAAPAARELVPVKYQPGARPAPAPPDTAFRLELTPEGRNGPVFNLSPDVAFDARVWERMPQFTWRFAHQGAKEGAGVLAWAREEPEGIPPGESPAVLEASDGDLAEALSRRRALERQNALVVVSQVDLGKVAFLAFDQTWRFRYGVGDTFHHRFWGQLIRWGAGENLPSGHDRVRLGTDKLTYEPGESVKIIARLTDEASRPVMGADVTVNVKRNGETVARRKLEYRPDSQGMYEGKLEAPEGAGEFQVELEGPEVARLTAAAGPVMHRFRVEPSGNPVELGDLTVDPQLAERLASLTGGRVFSLKDAARLADQFGPGTREVEERREISLWDHWLLLTIAAGALTMEWILRRRVSLA